MRTLHRCCRPALFVTAVLLAVGSAAGQPTTVLHSFTGGTADGRNPGGALTYWGSALYGMAYGAGSGGHGTLFQMNLDGSGYGTIHPFAGYPTDGGNPNGSLVPAGAALYGMTLAGGPANGGTLFSIGASGAAYGPVHTFPAFSGDGYEPYGTPALAGGVLYGLTSAGGTANAGSAFRTNLDGSNYSILHSFGVATTDGQAPNYGAPVVAGGVMYGATFGGGASGFGTIFRMNTDGSNYSVLHDFAGGTTDGLHPEASLILVGSVLYGTTAAGGPANQGAIFRMNLDGSNFSMVHSFLGGTTDGSAPESDLLAVGSTLYGTTALGGSSALGVLFGVQDDGSNFTVLHSFGGGAGDGGESVGDLILVGSALYGTTTIGGTSNFGTVYSFPIAVPEPSALLLTGFASLAVIVLRRATRGFRRRGFAGAITAGRDRPASGCPDGFACRCL
jgi:uncharacterized repeat protein (TIGR03803 family)